MIKGYSELILEAKSIKTARKYAKSLKNACDVLETYIEELSMITSVNRKKLTKNFKYFSLCEFIASIKMLVKFNIENKKQKITYLSNINDKTKIYFDKRLLTKVILNLLTNSIKYTDEGGNIYFSIYVFIENNIQKLFIFIGDTGKGIKQENINNIFDPYFQENKNSDGIGLGLSITKEIIDYLKGKIEITSYPNKGTFYRLEFNTLLLKS